MPYIKDAERSKVAPVLAALKVVLNDGFTDGELNYLFTKIGLLFLQQHGTSYNTISKIVGGLESAKLEFYRRVASTYEENKKAENGDVF